MTDYLYLGHIAECKFIEEDNLYQYLHSYDPFKFPDHYGPYLVHKVFRTLSKVIEEEKLYDPGNTEVLILNQELSRIIGAKVVFFKNFAKEIESRLSKKPPWGPIISVKASWIDRTAVLYKARRDPKTALLLPSSRVVMHPLLWDCLKEDIANKDLPFREMKKVIDRVFHYHDPRFRKNEMLDVRETPWSILSNAQFICGSRQLYPLISHFIEKAQQWSCPGCCRYSGHLAPRYVELIEDGTNIVSGDEEND